MNELTEVGALNEALARRYGGQSPLIFTMASDAFPVVQMSDSLMDPEMHFLAGSRLCAGSVFDAAPGVGINAQAGLQNPAASGAIIVVESIRVLEGSAAGIGSYDLRVTYDGVSAGPDATNRVPLRDGRFGTGARSTGLLYSLSAAAPVGVLMETIRVGSFLMDSFHSPPLVLPPNSQFTVFAQNANVDLQVLVRWRERRLNSQELQRGG